MVSNGCVALTALSLLGYATAGRALGEEWAEVGVLLLLLTPFMIGQFAVAPLSQTCRRRMFSIASEP